MNLAFFYELLLGVHSILSATRGNPITVLRRDAEEPLWGGQLDTAFKGIVGRIRISPCFLLAPCILQGGELCTVSQGPVS